MKKIKTLIFALSQTKWFFVKSWSYIVTDNPKGRIEFFKGVIPAWFRFTYYVYRDTQLIKSK